MHWYYDFRGPKIPLPDLDQFFRKHQRDNYNGLTTDYGEYFELTVDFRFDRGRKS